MPSDKVKNVLRSFGEGADTILQDALSRSARPLGAFDVSDGEHVDVPVAGAGTFSAQNPLDRDAIGAIVVNTDSDDANATARIDGEDVKVTVHGGSPTTVRVWVY